jgi:hypothetical protein
MTGSTSKPNCAYERPRASRRRSSIPAESPQLDHEWGRIANGMSNATSEMNAGLVSLSGVLPGALVNRKCLLLPAAVFASDAAISRT